MICITCGRVFRGRPVRYYFCSKICWEDANANTPWRILSDDDFGLLSPVKVTTSTRFPRPLWPSQRTRCPDRVEVPVGVL